MHIHFIGIKGVSMSVLSNIAVSLGHTVSGSDTSIAGHCAASVAGADLVVFSGAVKDDNEELKEARRLRIRTVERSVFLGEISRSFGSTVAIAGTHGKTSTTAMCYYTCSRLDPTLHLGGELIGESRTINSKRLLITEACEYRDSFLALRPHVGVALNAELDHTDYFKSFDDYLESFRKFLYGSHIPLINGDDENLLRIAPKNAVTFGLKESNRFCATDIFTGSSGSEFTVTENGIKATQVKVNASGKHSIYNALAAYSAARLCGIAPADAAKGIARYGGVKRRFEYLGDVRGARVYTDYAHHPTELKSTVDTARKKGAKKVTVIFEPHTYTRTESLLDGFALCLEPADRVILLPIYAAREKPIEGVTAHNIALKLTKKRDGVVYFDTYYKLLEYLSVTAEDGELIVFAGAGSIDEAARSFVKSQGGE